MHGRTPELDPRWALDWATSHARSRLLRRTPIDPAQSHTASSSAQRTPYQAFFEFDGAKQELAHQARCRNRRDAGAVAGHPGAPAFDWSSPVPTGANQPVSSRALRGVQRFRLVVRTPKGPTGGTALIEAELRRSASASFATAATPLTPRSLLIFELVGSRVA